MLFHVEMTVHLPADMDPVKAATLKAEEKAMCQRLMHEGVWRHLWRIAGRYANVSIFDVESVQQLHDLLSQLPLFPYMDVEVRALCRHPSSIREDDR
ncbi:muconolactone Delta-isomerase [Burkholderia sp. Bp8963]|uniref:muconolactone Delta-isomerase n=1 Tax=unclassified Burkholderia TaxID=2613784 RepID=UPI000F59123C|nr:MULTISPECIES: muconolactone Delta-isomerase [unclassified Burkholderia]MBN3786215.1 muconolactone Delta-isomerase [Burkholderia sp. Ac-20353]RQS69470.1 muconolactone Delta-isomerase [Burkholderia sp. Bp8963]